MVEAALQTGHRTADRAAAAVLEEQKAVALAADHQAAGRGLWSALGFVVCCRSSLARLCCCWGDPNRPVDHRDAALMRLLFDGGRAGSSRGLRTRSGQPLRLRKRQARPSAFAQARLEALSSSPRGPLPSPRSLPRSPASAGTPGRSPPPMLLSVAAEPQVRVLRAGSGSAGFPGSEAAPLPLRTSGQGLLISHATVVASSRSLSHLNGFVQQARRPARDVAAQQPGSGFRSDTLHSDSSRTWE